MGMDIENDKGEDFGFGIFSWDALLGLAKCAGYEVPDEWYYNDGDGLLIKADCTHFADVLEWYVNTMTTDRFYLETESPLRVDENGIILPHGSSGGFSPYSVDVAKVRRFIEYLRRSSSFEIW